MEKLKSDPYIPPSTLLRRENAKRRAEGNSAGKYLPHFGTKQLLKHRGAKQYPEYEAWLARRAGA